MLLNQNLALTLKLPKLEMILVPSKRGGLVMENSGGL